MGVNPPIGRAHNQRGFTLLELVVVLLLIGMIVGFALISLNGRGAEDAAEREAQRIYQLLRLAGDHAVIYGEDVGIAASESSYAFLILDEDSADQAWVPSPETMFRQRSLEPPLTLAMLVQDLPVDPEDDQGEARLVPSAVMLSTGEITPFELQLRNPDLRTYFSISGDITGKLTLERIDPDAPAQSPQSSG